MRSILCLIDLSESSISVVELAAFMAVQNSAHLMVLFSYRLIDHEPTSDIPRFKQIMEKKGKEKFADLEKIIKDVHVPSYEFFIEIGFITDRINFHLRRNSVDMIILSDRLANSINEMQSVSLQKFMKSTQRPFLIIPEPEKSKVTA